MTYHIVCIRYDNNAAATTTTCNKNENYNCISEHTLNMQCLQDLCKYRMYICCLDLYSIGYFYIMTSFPFLDNIEKNQKQFK